MTNVGNFFSNSESDRIQELKLRSKGYVHGVLDVADRLTELHHKSKSKGWKATYVEFETAQAMISLLTAAARELDGLVNALDRSYELANKRATIATNLFLAGQQLKQAIRAFEAGEISHQQLDNEFKKFAEC
ncbi:MAG: hypothetical protein KF846_04755 [Cyclobacteriaceae bacterium]|nr:hypothetical protein [Cyclobacteriaceae bacterium]